MKTFRIVTVCWGNIFRSQLAEFLFNQEISHMGLANRFICVSRGIQGSASVPSPTFPIFYDYEEEYPLAKLVLTKYQLDITFQPYQPINEQIVIQANLVLAVDEKVLSYPQGGLLAQFPLFSSKMILLASLAGQTVGIKDPAESSDENKYESIIPTIINQMKLAIPTILKL